MDGNFVYIRDLLLPSDALAALRINLLIFTLFLIGCLDALAALWLLLRERRRTDRALSELQTSRRAGPAVSTQSIVEFLGVPSGSPVARRVAQALQLRAARMGGLQRTAGSHLGRYGLLARYIAGILTLLGLLGTVLGLSFALFKIQGALTGVNEVEKLQELTGALGSTLQGMKTAFACTLAGLGTSLLLSLANHLVSRSQDSLAERLDDFTYRGLLPFLERLDPGADQAAKAFVQVLKDSAQELDKIREVIVSAASQYAMASQGFTGAVQELRGIVTTFESSVSSLASHQQGFTQALVETRDATRAMTAATTRQLDEVRGFTTLLEKLFDEHRSALRTSSDILVDLGLNLGSLFEKQGGTEGVEAQLKAFVTGAVEELKASSSALVSRLDQEHRAGAAEQMRSYQKAYEEALQRCVQRLEESMARSEKRLEPFFQSQNSALRAVSDMVVDFHYNLGPLFEKSAAGNGRTLPRTVPGS